MRSDGLMPCDVVGAGVRTLGACRAAATAAQCVVKRAECVAGRPQGWGAVVRGATRRLSGSGRDVRTGRCATSSRYTEHRNVSWDVS